MPITDREKNRNYQREWYHNNKKRLKNNIRDRRVSNRNKIDEYKELLGCICHACGRAEHPSALDFHHLNHEEKEYTVSKMVGYSWEKVQKEIDKCILLCACCHRKIHKDLLCILLSVS
jgi:hypothetical protein